MYMHMFMTRCIVFFFKQKTAYEMRISDWSSDVCSSDLKVEFNGVDLLELEPEERAVAGLFLAFQYPVELPGVTGMTFLRTALNAMRKTRGESEEIGRASGRERVCQYV